MKHLHCALPHLPQITLTQARVIFHMFKNSCYSYSNRFVRATFLSRKVLPRRDITRLQSSASVFSDAPTSYDKLSQPRDFQRELPQLRDFKIDTKSKTYKESLLLTDAQVKQLHERLAFVRQGGGEKAIQKHLERNKMMPRDRIDNLIDPGSPFLELSALAGMYSYPDEDEKSQNPTGEMNVPSASIVTGIGIVAGVPTMIIANDATVKGGTYHAITVKKHLVSSTVYKSLIASFYQYDVIFISSFFLVLVLKLKSVR